MPRPPDQPTPNREGRGLWRGIYCAIFEHRDYQALTPHAKLVLLTLRLGPMNTMASLFTFYPGVLERHTGLRPAEVAAALHELETKPTTREPWIVRDETVCWVRNGLRHDPNVVVTNVNHVKALRRIVAALNRASAVVQRFRRHYKEIRLEGHPQGDTQGHPQGDTQATTPTPTPTPKQKQKPKLEGPDVSDLSGSDNGTRSRPRGAYQELLAQVKREQPNLSQAEAEVRALVLFQGGVRGSRATAGVES